MKLKDLKRKLDLISEECNDFEIMVDAADYNLLNIESLYIGGAWNIVLSCHEEDEDIEDLNTEK
ncbi:hypothetical protein CMU04_06485 [Elizabethkingia anophelis]|nr:hypothetical protein [Elizabethkingia anophelis]